MSDKKFFRLSAQYTTQAVPRRISTTHGSETLTTMKEILAVPPKGNSGIAALCVTLALLEASENGKLTKPSEEDDLDITDNKFTWKDASAGDMQDSISYSLQLLLPEEFKSEAELKQLIQHTLIPRGAEIIEERDYMELCDYIMSFLDE